MNAEKAYGVPNHIEHQRYRKKGSRFIIVDVTGYAEGHEDEKGAGKWWPPLEVKTLEVQVT